MHGILFFKFANYGCYIHFLPNVLLKPKCVLSHCDIRWPRREHRSRFKLENSEAIEESVTL